MLSNGNRNNIIRIFNFTKQVNLMHMNELAINGGLINCHYHNCAKIIIMFALPVLFVSYYNQYVMRITNLFPP